MQPLPLNRAFTLIEPGPVVLVSTFDGHKNNVMTITWTMVMGFEPTLAITTSPWNYSYQALCKTRECVLSIPSVEMLDTVMGIGGCSGASVNKFNRFHLKAVEGQFVQAPLIEQSYGNIECEIVEIIEPFNIFVLNGLAAYINPEIDDPRMLHATGDGYFIADGECFNCRAMMADKLPLGV